MTWILPNWKKISELSLEEKKELLNSLEKRKIEIENMTVEEYRTQNKPTFSAWKRTDWTVYQYTTQDWNVTSTSYSVNKASNTYSIPISHDKVAEIQVEAIGSPESVEWIEHLLTQ